MRTLVIDCATEACSVALFSNADLIAGANRILGRGHAEQLVPMIAALPDRGRADRIAVSCGPGSFTGLRVGLSSARALAFAWGAELYGYSTLALVAAMARNQQQGAVCVAMTGGHSEWFVQEFDEEGMASGAIASLSPRDAANAAAPLVAGSQAEALTALRGWGDALPLWPDARQFMCLPPEHVLAGVQPIYGRPPDAKPA